MNTDWTKNLISYCERKQAGNYPDSGSRKIEIGGYIFGIRKSLTLCCKDTRKWEHLDGYNTQAAE